MNQNTNNPIRTNGSPSEPTSNGTGKSEAALREEKVLEFWRENKIFEKSVEERKGEKEFVFYDGPPTANGKPGTHHLIPGAFKDAIPRYKTMRGYHVRRKGGWDTHGLPVELQVEKKLGLNYKKAIEEYGIAKFNQECKESVWEYVDLWHKFTDRIGFWVDKENPFVTYHNDYIESVWNIVKKVNEQKLLYKDYKVVPWCPRCGTALSSHELAQGYEDVKDLSVYVKFKLKASPDAFVQSLGPSLRSATPSQKHAGSAYLLAWTTTPWTLLGNVGLAVGEDIDYVEIKVGEEILVLAKERLSIISDPYEIVAEHKGKEMIGMQYEPLFPFFADTISESEKPKLAKAYKVYGANFVTTTDGTGIVHTAVMYGQEDFVLGTEVGLPKHHTVNLEGKFIKGTGFLEGRFVKEKNEEGKPTLDVDIIKYLTEKNLFFAKENYAHSYPHCWRCKTALIYYARDSWYIKMSDPKIKKQLISENQKINWEPAYTRDGRFGEWLKDIKDWAISRERYWGTPLPVWACEACKKVEVVGSIEDLKNKIKKSGNKYFVMRHGGSIGNMKNVSSFKPGEENDALTDQGREQVKSQAKKLKQKPDIIISSNFTRTRQTAETVAEVLGISKEEILINEELREAGAIKSPDEKVADIRKRMIGVLQDLEEKYSGKNILIISHEDPLRILMSSYESLNEEEESENLKNKYLVIQNAEILQCNFLPLPRNDEGELDLHRPYIDEVPLVCDCGGNLVRTREVMDVWFDSGCMPFAQDHYPFDPEPKQAWYGAGNKKSQQILYPADFIAEAIDQTRGWFYTLHAVGILMGKGLAYKNVICLGHLLDANGKKMSKSLGNIVDPWVMISKYGVDTLRLWMYSVNQPGESKNFDEKTVALLHQQVFGLLYNVLAFYELYPAPEQARYGASRDKIKSKHVLDQWILARFDELVKISTENLDNYKLLEPTRAIRDFIGDLSTWYLRRSRERIKEEAANPEVEQAHYGARQTLYFVLKNLAKVMAPLAPFAAEDIWSKLRGEKDEESVHLTKWPKAEKVDSEIIENMRMARAIVSFGLEARQKAKIPVRQPLTLLKYRPKKSATGEPMRKLPADYFELIKEELNVKEIMLDDAVSADVELDTKITPKLKAEGEYREFMRELQDMRKKMGLNPSDKMPMTVEMLYKKYKIVPSLGQHMLRVAAVAVMVCDNFTEPLPKEEIVIACLLHDMGNIIKADFRALPKLLEPEGLEYWQKVKDEYISKYGINNEHYATIKIMQELDVSKEAISIADHISFSLACKNRDQDNFAYKIANYADWRVNPYGVVSFEDRQSEAKNRYQHRKDNGHTEEEREKLVNCGRDIEKQIFTKCKIKPEDINDETIKSVISSLRAFVIK